MRGPTWKPEEIVYLEDAWDHTPIPAIAKKLGRSVDAVKEKAIKLGLGRHLHAGTMITFNQFCIAIGKGPMKREMLEWFRKLGLPIHQKRTYTRSYPMVDIDEFWKWAADHKDKLDFSRIEPGTFGKEPAWVKEARRIDTACMIKKTPWTKSDDRRLAQLLGEYRYTYDDLSRILQRTEGAIKRRIYDLALPQRPMRREIRPWTDEEVRQLVDMRVTGYGYEAIAEKLGRSALAVRGKYEHLQNPDYTKRLYRNNREAISGCFQRLQCSHFTKTVGCELKHTDCDTCPDFKRLMPDEKRRSGWVPHYSVSPAEIAKQRSLYT